jgi:metal-sulfur cluster biosynthetic enzyme
MARGGVNEDAGRFTQKRRRLRSLWRTPGYRRGVPLRPRPAALARPSQRAEPWKERRMPTEQDIKRALRKVKDPELNLDLVVLGLVYGIEIQDSHVHAKISLTTPFCPAANQILDEARAAVEGVEGVTSAEIELTFDPPWTPERIDPIIRASLGF